MKKHVHVPVSFQDGEHDLAAGQLVITATTTDQKVTALNHFNRYSSKTELEKANELIKAVQSDKPLILRPKAGGRDCHWFCRRVCVEEKWVAPYINLLRKRTGYPEESQVIHSIPDVHLYDHWGCLHHTHYIIEMHIEHNCLVADIVVSASDWNGKTGEERAQSHVDGAVISSIAHTVHEPEYIQCGNLFKPNPKYASGRYERRPATEQQWLMNALVDWWLKTHATDTQREIVAVSHALNDKNHHGVSDLHNIRGYGNMRFSWHSNEIPWAEFQTITPERWAELQRLDAIAIEDAKKKNQERLDAAEAARKKTEAGEKLAAEVLAKRKEQSTK